MTLFDTHVLLDIAAADPVWRPWSAGQPRAAMTRAAMTRGPAVVNPRIHAELAPAFATAADLDHWLDPALFRRLP